MEVEEKLGLTETEAEEKFKKFGLNDVEEKKDSWVKKYLAPLNNPISWMLLGAAVLSYINGRDIDFYFIMALYFVNYLIQKWQEFKADKAIEELRNKLSFDVRVSRDSEWIFINAKMLVPGDLIRLGLGSIIPADADIVHSNNLSVNEAVLTGESLPKAKKLGDKIFSGSFIAAGNVEALITATGKDTSFGKTIYSIEKSTDKSLLEKDILSISKFLMKISTVSVLILSVVFLLKGVGIEDLLTLDLSLIIAGVPIALPAVMAIILSIGAAGLAKKQVVVRRLSALQDLANVNMLLSDKTGTLTKNEISVTKIISYNKQYGLNKIIEFSHFASISETPDTIDTAVNNKYNKLKDSSKDIKLLNYISYDSDRKRSTSYVEVDGEKTLVSLGAPQIVKALGKFESDEMSKKFDDDIDKAAQEGYRVLALAIKNDSEEEKDMKVIGLLSLADPLDEGSTSTIKFMRENGIEVKMVTGDNKLIAERIAKVLQLPGKVLSATEAHNFFENTDTSDRGESISTFAEILPKDKYDIVKYFKNNYVVAATGDGINDLPALKIANVGIAVSGAVTALKSLADIVLLGKGITVIKDAILESRKIFIRLYNYSVYRISESFRLIVTILILGLAYGFYPLVPLQIIILAFLNDIPIISLAFDRVKISTKPSQIKTKRRLALSLMFGTVGIMNSLVMFVVCYNLLGLPLSVIQTMFFLKLTVSGHELIFVAHTKERWYNFLPSKQVIIATLTTQALATVMALTGFMMPSKISIWAVVAVWVWTLFWMQITEVMKDLQIFIQKKMGTYSTQ